MASKKKRTPPRPQSGSRPAAKRPAQPQSGSQSTVKPGGPGPGKAGAQGKAATKPARERTGPTRAERLAAAEAARRRKAARTRALIAGGLVAVLALLTVTIVNSRRSNDGVEADLESSGACKYDTRADGDDGPGRNHVTGDITYQVDPPSGGNHNPTAAGPGVYTLESKPPDGQIVHAQEHGYVTLWYKPDVAPATVDQLRELANRYNRDVLLVPRPTMEPAVAATAWNRRLLCSEPDGKALEQFITEYRNKGPEKIPH